MIRDPDRPIGTHVFTAMASNDAGLRWTAVTIDNGDDAKDALDGRGFCHLGERIMRPPNWCRAAFILRAAICRKGLR